MKTFFNKLKTFLSDIFSSIKKLFIKNEPTVDERPVDKTPVDKTAVDDKPIDKTQNNNIIEEVLNVEKPEPSTNNPIDPDNIKHGEIGGYVMYNKENTEINTEFINNLKELGISLLYINTPRGENTTLSFSEWLDIFDKFKDSGIKLMLYIYEAVSVKPKWTNSEIVKISTHPSFYGWIGEDEVSYSSYNGGNAWITRFHNEKWSDGSRKWPNIAACYYPKLSNLNSDMIGETYYDYLKLWSSSIDIAHADMYPFVSDRTNNAHLNIESNGSPIYSIPEGGENWFSYLKEHLKFTKEYTDITHRLYMHSCKHVAKDNKGNLYIARPKPTELMTKIQAYANLLAGSNGLMLFVLNDILSGNAGFGEAPFNSTLNINKDTYAVIKNVITAKDFVNYKNIITNLCVSDLKNNDELIISYANNNEYLYKSILNTSLEKTIQYEVPANNIVLDLNSLTEIKLKENKLYDIHPGELLFIKEENIVNV